jgi:hypothetical protein
MARTGLLRVGISERRVKRAVSIESGETITRLTADAREISADYNLSVRLRLYDEDGAVSILINNIWVKFISHLPARRRIRHCN